MSRKRIKQYLMLLTVVGLIAVAANGSGTFASFSAEVTNSGNTFATGTLFLHEKNGSTVCTSESSSTNISAADCGLLFDYTQGFIKPGTTNHADITLTNAGSLDVSDLDFFTPTLTSGQTCDDFAPTIATFTQTVSAGSLPQITGVTGLTQNLYSGEKITIADSNGGNAQTFTVGATATTSDNSITLSNATASAHTYTSGIITIDTSNFGGSGLCGFLKVSIASYPSGYTAGQGTCVYGGTGTADDTNGCGAPVAISSIGATGNSLGLPLNHATSKYLRVFVTAPTTNNNAYQNEEAKFDFSWHIAQT